MLSQCFQPLKPASEVRAFSPHDFDADLTGRRDSVQHFPVRAVGSDYAFSG